MTSYNQIIQQIRQLSPSQKLHLLEDIASMVRQQIASKPPNQIEPPINHPEENHEEQQPQSLAAAFAKLRQICTEEDYSWEIPARSDRFNPFA